MFRRDLLQASLMGLLSATTAGCVGNRFGFGESFPHTNVSRDSYDGNETLIYDGIPLGKGCESEPIELSVGENAEAGQLEVTFEDFLLTDEIERYYSSINNSIVESRGNYQYLILIFEIENTGEISSDRISSRQFNANYAGEGVGRFREEDLGEELVVNGERLVTPRYFSLYPNETLRVAWPYEVPTTFDSSLAIVGFATNDATIQWGLTKDARSYLCEPIIPDDIYTLGYETPHEKFEVKNYYFTDKVDMGGNYVPDRSDEHTKFVIIQVESTNKSIWVRSVPDFHLYFFDEPMGLNPAVDEFTFTANGNEHQGRIEASGSLTPHYWPGDILTYADAFTVPNTFKWKDAQIAVSSGAILEFPD